MVETELRNSLPGQSLLVPCDRQLKMGTQGLCISSTTVCDVKSQGNTQEMSLDGTSKFEKLLDKSAEGPSSLQGRQAKLEQLEQSLAATSKLLPNVLEDCAEKPDVAILQKTVKLPSSTRSPPGTLKEALSVLKEAAGVCGVQLTEAPVPGLKGADEQTKTLKGNIAGEAVNQDVDLDSSLMEASKVEEPSTSFQASGGLLDADVAELRALLETAIQESGSNEVALDDDRTVKFEAPANNVGISGPCPAEVTPRQLTRGMVPAALAEDLYDSSRSQNSQSAGPCRSHSALSCASWMASSVGDSLEFSRSSVGYAVFEEGKLQEASVGSSPSRGGQDASVTAVSVDSTQLKAFTSAVQSAPGLGQDLQKELLELLGGLPGSASRARHTQ